MVVWFYWWLLQGALYSEGPFITATCLSLLLNQYDTSKMTHFTNKVPTRIGVGMILTNLVLFLKSNSKHASLVRLFCPSQSSFLFHPGIWPIMNLEQNGALGMLPHEERRQTPFKALHCARSRQEQALWSPGLTHSSALSTLVVCALV